MHWLKLHTIDDNAAVFINMDNVIRIKQTDHGSFLDFNDANLYAEVVETPEEIMALVLKFFKE